MARASGPIETEGREGEAGGDDGAASAVEEGPTGARRTIECDARHGAGSG